MSKFTERQKKVYELLKEMAVDGCVKISNADLAYQLFKKKKFTGHAGNPVGQSEASRFLKQLSDKKLILIEFGNTTRDRIIKILNNLDYENK